MNPTTDPTNTEEMILMTDNGSTDAPKFTVTSSRAGYAHTEISGTYTGKATAADVEKAFFGHFGGCDARAWDGHFSCVRYDD